MSSNKFDKDLKKLEQKSQQLYDNAKRDLDKQIYRLETKSQQIYNQAEKAAQPWRGSSDIKSSKADDFILQQRIGYLKDSNSSTDSITSKFDKIKKLQKEVETTKAKISQTKTPQQTAQQLQSTNRVKQPATNNNPTATKPEPATTTKANTQSTVQTSTVNNKPTENKPEPVTTTASASTESTVQTSTTNNKSAETKPEPETNNNATALATKPVLTPAQVMAKQFSAFIDEQIDNLNNKLTKLHTDLHDYCLKKSDEYYEKAKDHFINGMKEIGDTIIALPGKIWNKFFGSDDKDATNTVAEETTPTPENTATSRSSSPPPPGGGMTAVLAKSKQDKAQELEQEQELKSGQQLGL